MKRPATSGGRRKTSAPEIKVTRNSPRPQIKASRGPGGPVKTRKVAPSSRGKSAPRSVSEADRRVAETRRQSLSSMGKGTPAPRSRRKTDARPKPASRPKTSARPRTSSAPRGGGARPAAAPRGGGGSVRAVAVGAGGGVAAGALRVAQEAARPVGAVTRPVLRVVSGGLEALPQAAGRATPIARGRALILLAGVLAAGLIYINVGKLEAGDGYSKYAARSLELQRQNNALNSRIANLRAAERIQRYAQRQGMVYPAPEQYTYLDPKRGDALKASRGYTAPLTHAIPSSGSTAATGASAATGVDTSGSTAVTGAGL